MFSTYYFFKQWVPNNNWCIIQQNKPWYWCIELITEVVNRCEYGDGGGEEGDAGGGHSNAVVPCVLPALVTFVRITQAFQRIWILFFVAAWFRRRFCGGRVQGWSSVIALTNKHIIRFWYLAQLGICTVFQRSWFGLVALIIIAVAWITPQTENRV